MINLLIDDEVKERILLQCDMQFVSVDL